MNPRDDRNRDQLLGPGVDAMRPCVIALHGESRAEMTLNGEEQAVVAHGPGCVFLHDAAVVLPLSRVLEKELPSLRCVVHRGARAVGLAGDDAARTWNIDGRI